MTIADVVHKSDTPGGQRFDKAVLAVILLWLVALSIGTLPGLSPAWVSALTAFDTAIVVLFTFEYILRLATAPRPWRFARSFFGLVDLVAILPFYLAFLSVGIDLRAVRALRLLRLLRVLRVFQIPKYRAAMVRLGRAVRYAREEAMVFLFATLILLYVAAMGIHYFEHEAQPEHFQSVFHSLWWAVVTVTTVGYGDTYPVTVGGRIFTFVILLCAMGIVAVPAGLIASGLSRAIQDEREAARAAADPGTPPSDDPPPT